MCFSITSARPHGDVSVLSRLADSASERILQAHFLKLSNSFQPPRHSALLFKIGTIRLLSKMEKYINTAHGV